MKKIRNPIWLKLIIRIGLPLIVIYMFILFFNYTTNKKNALDSTQKYLIELTEHNAEILNIEFEQISHCAAGIKNLIESSDEITEDIMFQYIVRELQQDNDNVASGVAFLPGEFGSEKDKYANLIHKADGKYVISDVAERYDYLREDWFAIPKILNRGYWTEPFWGKINGALLMVRAFPIMKKDEVIGVSYSDLSLKILSDLMEKSKIMKGYSFIISRNGTFIYHPNENYVMKESIFSLANQYERPEIRDLGRKMIKGESQSMSYQDFDSDQKKWIVFTPIKSTGWSFAAVIPEETILKEVRKNVIKQLWLMITGLIIILAIIIVVAKKVSEPLKKLAIATNDIAGGHLETKIDEFKGKDEIAALGSAFNKMTDNLNSHIKNLTNITKAKEAVESEMRIARSIQESLLPRIFPAFPERVEFDLYAKNIAAKEVAGDFYDFFFLNDNLMAVIIADVSGKGISAGLFMAVTRTLLKTVCSSEISPAAALNKTNNILCQDNDACMFTTLFLGFYDIFSGKIVYSNAGHDYPFVVSEEGKCQIIKTKQDIALGIDEDHVFKNGEITLEKEQTLILYTDGVIEATNKDNCLFGEDRFIELLVQNSHTTLENMMNSITSELAEYQGNKQFDDITMLFLKRNK